MKELPGQLSLWPGVVAPVPMQSAAAESILPSDEELARLPDGAARARIQRVLDRNMLVEAGAGAGKTTEMVNRMLALVLGGVPVTEVAAVTFTRKAAAELRERFQTQVEVSLRTARAQGDVATADMLEQALREIDRAFIGTIHAFCARLLRERPVEAGIDPGFRELQAAEQGQLAVKFWHTHLDRLAADGDPQLVALNHAGLRPNQLFDLFTTLVEQPDVTFDAPESEPPDVDQPRRALERWLDEAQRLIPRDEPEDGWDGVQQAVRRLRYHRYIVGWDDPIDFLNALLDLPSSPKKVQKRWADDAAGKAQAKALFEDYAVMMAEGGVLERTIRAWRAHRYPIALRFALRAADAFREHREREALLTFQDLLMFAAKLLREHSRARADLSDRYRYLLVDEFQDTDPIQAEVVFLLAAGADVPESDGAADWTRAIPRPGSLFVVGDPKQSIYRFRRADITIYNQVKQRLREHGEVVELTANFRSRPAIAGFVNATFNGAFPPQETETQAAFALMNAQKNSAASAGVRWYLLDDGGESGRRVMERDDPERIAHWVAERIRRGERKPGDFLVLTRMNKFLSAYARALEARGVPVQVSGGGVGIERELEELLILLRALEDPGDPTRTLAALVGLFFGLDYDRIAAYVLGPVGNETETRRSLEFLKLVPDEATLVTEDERAVADALRSLRRWWHSMVIEPADIAVGRIIDELGLLPHAAAGDLGETRAGAVLFLLDTLRAAAARGDASLSAALSALEAAFDDDDGEAPLRPGRADVVRLMTLHKAKGLEAPVVILAAPFGEWDAPIQSHIERNRDGHAVGWLRVAERENYKVRIHAQPEQWPDLEAREREFAEAEDVRLLYVAATRAEDELIVSVPPDKEVKKSPWRMLYPTTIDHGRELLLPLVEAAPRAVLEVGPEEMQQRVAMIEERRRTRALPTYRAAPVKLRAGELSDYELQAVRRGRGPSGRGVEWGSAVHGALEAAMRGTEGNALRARARSLLLAAERPVDERGEPAELEELLGIVQAVRAAPLWQRARAADILQIEASFALMMSGAEYAALAGDTDTDTGDADARPREIIEGVLDLAFREPDGWTIVDYKSDAAGSGIDDARRAKYRAQVNLYALAWERITGEPVRERVLLFTADGRTEAW